MADPKTKTAPKYPAMGGRIRATRQALKMKLEVFAVAVELTVNHITRIERGEVMPHNRKLARICNTLGLVQHWVCTGKGRKFLREGETNPVEGCT